MSRYDQATIFLYTAFFNVPSVSFVRRESPMHCAVFQHMIYSAFNLICKALRDQLAIWPALRKGDLSQTLTEEARLGSALEDLFAHVVLWR